jgi:glycosyltransferase involved in cell wall biosynthesis
VLAGAFERVAARDPDARLVVAGEGPERERLEALGQRLGGDRVVLRGRLDEPGISAHLSAVRVVVVPSLPSVRPEGSPLAAVEAALHGRPLVTSDDPGLVETLSILGAGEAVPAGDVAALAAALDRVLTDDELAMRWSEQSRRTAIATFAHDVVTARVREVHERVVAEVRR